MITDENIKRPAWDDYGFDPFMTRTLPYESLGSSDIDNLSTPTSSIPENEVANMFGDDTIPGTSIKAGTIYAKSLVVGEQTFSHNLVFSTTSADSLSWSGGSVKLGSGQTITTSLGSLSKIYQNTAAFVNDTETVLLAHLDETSGSTAADSSSNAASGTVSTATVDTSIKRYGAASRSFNGTTGYISYPSITAYNITGYIQIEASIYPTATTSMYTVISKGLASTSYPFYLKIGSRTTTPLSAAAIVFGYKDTSGNLNEYYTTNNVITTDVWQDIKVIYTFGVASSIKVYLNNVLVPGNWAVGTGTTPVLTSSTPIYIGDNPDHTEVFKGRIDEVRIKTLYPGTALTSDSNTVLLAHLEEASGNVTDSSTLAATGTNTGTTASSTIKRVGTYSRQFNGSSYLSFAYNAAYNITNQIQIEASIYPTSIGLNNTIVGRANNSGTADQYILRVNNSGSGNFIEFFYYDGSVYHVWQSTKPMIALNTWYDIKLTHIFGIPGALKMSINGYPIPGSWISGTGASATVASTTIPLTIGCTMAGTSDVAAQFFTGYIDEVRIKNYIDADPAITMPTQYYIYYDGNMALKYTTTFSDAVGTTKKIMGIWTPSTTYGKSAVQVFSSIGTTIDGSQIVTGAIRSNDGRTVFDLNNQYIKMNDGANDRLLLGFQKQGF